MSDLFDAAALKVAAEELIAPCVIVAALAKHDPQYTSLSRRMRKIRADIMTLAADKKAAAQNRR